MSTHRVNNIDTNIQNYTLSELMAIVQLQELDPDEITEKTHSYIKKFEKSNPILSAFFTELQSELLKYSQGLIVPDKQNTTGKIVVDSNKKEGYQNMNDASNPSNQQQQSDWDNNQYLQQSDPNQTNKITNRQQTTQTFGNPQVPMNQTQIATTDTYNLPVKQDSLNPTLKNVITRFVNLDSQFRKYTNGTESSSTDYTLDLSDTLKDALSLRLFSFQIPMSWYAIDKYYGNTCFWIIDGDYNIAISIPSGNYTQSEFVKYLTTSFTEAGFDLTTAVIPTKGTAPATYNVNNGKLTLYLNGVTYNPTGTEVLFTISTNTVVLFYDFSSKLVCENNCFTKANNYLNNTLGWLMGYRLPYMLVLENGNEAPAILDLNGSKYLILVLDDYNQNHINNSVVSISKFKNSLKMPEYFTGDLTYSCNQPTDGGANNLPELVNGVKLNSLLDFQTTNPLNGLLIGGKYEQSFTTTQHITPSAPRQLTHSQIYTINEIIKNKNNSTINYLSRAPTSGDIIALLPVKTSVGVPTGNLLVEFAGSIQENKRMYFGPVDIDRMAVKLLDDKGNTLNLNGNDWTVTFICECLYQY